MIQLSKQQENLLMDLARDPEWMALLDAIGKERKVSPWKPGTDSEDQRQAKWIYESGILRGISDTLTTLRLGKT